MSEVDQLKEQLQTKIAELDRVRREETERFSKEREEKRFLEEAARAERVRVEREKQAEHLRRKEKEKQEQAQRVQKETEERIKRESALNETQELNRKLREQYEYIQAEIEKAEFVEEQHRKSMESDIAVAGTFEEASEINVEHPTPPTNHEKPGEAVDGTQGLENSALMSQHLKHILRQANRNY